jgi:hypothetical protein
MTDFDELIGAEPTGAERERLRSVHELLVEAGPAPELSSALAAGPKNTTMGSRVLTVSRRRRVTILMAAAALVVLVVAIATNVHIRGSRYPSLAMQATSFAPGATGTLEILPAKGKTQPLQLEVKGLTPLKRPYVVYLVRNGRLVAPCGSFTVSRASRDLTVKLDSPYRLGNADRWIVTEPPRSGTGPGPTVLQTVT